MQAARVLVVDDEEAIRTVVRRALAFDGHQVQTAGDGQECLAQMSIHAPDAIVLDVRMPGLDGLEVCQRIRAGGDDTPILMLTAHDEVSDRVAGLDAGADDYMAKPFAVQELQARVRALLRRRHGHDPLDETLRFADLSLSLAEHRAERGGRTIDLTRTEFALLEMFMRNPRRVLTRSMIYAQVWGYDFGPTSNSIPVYIGYLRRKLEANGEPRLVHTMHGTGYVLREP